MIELKMISHFPCEIIALDEVGRSPLSGPVVIGALRVVVASRQDLETLLRSFRRCGVKDSKLLKTEGRQKLLTKFCIRALPYREKGTFLWKGLELSFVTWEMDHAVIDQENILAASLRGMKEAALFLRGPKSHPTNVLIDGHLNLRWPDGAPPWQEFTIIKGDVKSSLIGLAAIIAKEQRDSWMRQMHLLYPLYGFETNYGYPTKEHRLAIAQHGPCPIHRKSFCKVKEFIASSEEVR